MWKIMYHPEAEQELKKLDGSQQKIVLKAIIKVSQNPESNMKGGYGKPLGNKGGNNLSGLQAMIWNMKSSSIWQALMIL